MKNQTLISTNDDKYNYKNSIVPPIAQSAIFTFGSYEQLDAYINQTDEEKHYAYGRGDTPGTDVLAEKLAELAGGEDCCLVSSGMGAIALVFLSFLKTGDHLICVQNTYSTARGFINDMVVGKMGVEVTYVDGDCIEDFETSLQSNTKMIYLESPSSAVFHLQDIQAVSELVKNKNIKIAIDNTYATMLYQKPLLLGADIEIHSLSKYINGHNDVVGGAIIGSRKDIKKIRNQTLIQVGSNLSSFDAWLVLRGLRTLPQRLKQQEESANWIAQKLNENNKTFQVNHVSLKNFKQYDLFKKQMTGSSGLFSFEVKTSKEKIKKFLSELKLFNIGISWGGYESMVYISSLSKPYYRDANNEEEINVVIRISIGLEDYQDLWEDLENGLSFL